MLISTFTSPLGLLRRSVIACPLSSLVAASSTIMGVADLCTSLATPRPRYRGAYIPGYMGLAATMGIPMGACVLVLSPNDNQPHPRGDETVLEENKNVSKFFRCH